MSNPTRPVWALPAIGAGAGTLFGLLGGLNIDDPNIVPSVKAKKLLRTLVLGAAAGLGTEAMLRGGGMLYNGLMSKSSSAKQIDRLRYKTLYSLIKQADETTPAITPVPANPILPVDVETENPVSSTPTVAPPTAAPVATTQAPAENVAASASTPTATTQTPPQATGNKTPSKEPWHTKTTMGIPNGYLGFGLGGLLGAGLLYHLLTEKKKRKPSGYLNSAGAGLLAGLLGYGLYDFTNRGWGTSSSNNNKQNRQSPKVDPAAVSPFKQDYFNVLEKTEPASRRAYGANLPRSDVEFFPGASSKLNSEVSRLYNNSTSRLDEIAFGDEQTALDARNDLISTAEVVLESNGVPSSEVNAVANELVNNMLQRNAQEDRIEHHAYTFADNVRTIVSSTLPTTSTIDGVTGDPLPAIKQQVKSQIEKRIGRPLTKAEEQDLGDIVTQLRLNMINKNDLDNNISRKTRQAFGSDGTNSLGNTLRAAGIWAADTYRDWYDYFYPYDPNEEWRYLDENGNDIRLLKRPPNSSDISDMLVAQGKLAQQKVNDSINALQDFYTEVSKTNPASPAAPAAISAFTGAPSPVTTDPGSLLPIPPEGSPWDPSPDKLGAQIAAQGYNPAGAVVATWRKDGSGVVLLSDHRLIDLTADGRIVPRDGKPAPAATSTYAPGSPVPASTGTTLNTGSSSLPVPEVTSSTPTTTPIDTKTFKGKDGHYYRLTPEGSGELFDEGTRGWIPVDKSVVISQRTPVSATPINSSTIDTPIEEAQVEKDLNSDEAIIADNKKYIETEVGKGNVLVGNMLLPQSDILSLNLDPDSIVNAKEDPERSNKYEAAFPVSFSDGQTGIIYINRKTGGGKLYGGRWPAGFSIVTGYPFQNKEETVEGTVQPDVSPTIIDTPVPELTPADSSPTGQPDSSIPNNTPPVTGDSSAAEQTDFSILDNTALVPGDSSATEQLGDMGLNPEETIELDDGSQVSIGSILTALGLTAGTGTVGYGVAKNYTNANIKSPRQLAELYAKHPKGSLLPRILRNTAVSARHPIRTLAEGPALSEFTTFPHFYHVPVRKRYRTPGDIPNPAKAKKLDAFVYGQTPVEDFIDPKIAQPLRDNLNRAGNGVSGTIDPTRLPTVADTEIQALNNRRNAVVTQKANAQQRNLPTAEYDAQLRKIDSQIAQWETFKTGELPVTPDSAALQAIDAEIAERQLKLDSLDNWENYDESEIRRLQTEIADKKAAREKLFKRPVSTDDIVSMTIESHSGLGSNFKNPEVQKAYRKLQSRLAQIDSMSIPLNAKDKLFGGDLGNVTAQKLKQQARLQFLVEYNKATAKEANPIYQHWLDNFAQTGFEPGEIRWKHTLYPGELEAKLQAEGLALDDPLVQRALNNARVQDMSFEDSIRYLNDPQLMKAHKELEAAKFQFEKVKNVEPIFSDVQVVDPKAAAADRLKRAQAAFDDVVSKYTYGAAYGSEVHPALKDIPYEIGVSQEQMLRDIDAVRTPPRDLFNKPAEIKKAIVEQARARFGDNHPITIQAAKDYDATVTYLENRKLTSEGLHLAENLENEKINARLAQREAEEAARLAEDHQRLLMSIAEERKAAYKAGDMARVQQLDNQLKAFGYDPVLHNQDFFQKLDQEWINGIKNGPKPELDPELRKLIQAKRAAEEAGDVRAVRELNSRINEIVNAEPGKKPPLFEWPRNSRSSGRFTPIDMISTNGTFEPRPWNMPEQINPKMSNPFDILGEQLSRTGLPEVSPNEPLVDSNASPEEKAFDFEARQAGERKTNLTQGRREFLNSEETSARDLEALGTDDAKLEAARIREKARAQRATWFPDEVTPDDRVFAMNYFQKEHANIEKRIKDLNSVIGSSAVSAEDKALARIEINSLLHDKSVLRKDLINLYKSLSAEERTALRLHQPLSGVMPNGTWTSQPSFFNQDEIRLQEHVPEGEEPKASPREIYTKQVRWEREANSAAERVFREIDKAPTIEARRAIAQDIVNRIQDGHFAGRSSLENPHFTEDLYNKVVPALIEKGYLPPTVAPTYVRPPSKESLEGRINSLYDMQQQMDAVNEAYTRYTKEGVIPDFAKDAVEAERIRYLGAIEGDVLGGIASNDKMILWYANRTVEDLAADGAKLKATLSQIDSQLAELKKAAPTATNLEKQTQLVARRGGVTKQLSAIDQVNILRAKGQLGVGPAVNKTIKDNAVKGAMEAIQAGMSDEALKVALPSIEYIKKLSPDAAEKAAIQLLQSVPASQRKAVSKLLAENKIKGFRGVDKAAKIIAALHTIGALDIGMYGLPEGIEAGADTYEALSKKFEEEGIDPRTAAILAELAGTGVGTGTASVEGTDKLPEVIRDVPTLLNDLINLGLMGAGSDFQLATLRDYIDVPKLTEIVSAAGAGNIIDGEFENWSPKLRNLRDDQYKEYEKLWRNRVIDNMGYSNSELPEASVNPSGWDPEVYKIQEKETALKKQLKYVFKNDWNKMTPDQREEAMIYVLPAQAQTNLYFKNKASIARINRELRKLDDTEADYLNGASFTQKMFNPLAADRASLQAERERLLKLNDIIISSQEAMEPFTGNPAPVELQDAIESGNYVLAASLVDKAKELYKSNPIFAQRKQKLQQEEEANRKREIQYKIDREGLLKYEENLLAELAAGGTWRHIKDVKQRLNNVRFDLDSKYGISRRYDKEAIINPSRTPVIY